MKLVKREKIKIEKKTRKKNKKRKRKSKIKERKRKIEIGEEERKERKGKRNFKKRGENHRRNSSSMTKRPLNYFFVFIFLCSLTSFDFIISNNFTV